MNLKEIRYRLFQLKDQAEREVEIPELPEDFKESFEEQDAFRGWINFGVKWDVDEKDPWKIVKRKKSIEEEWNEVLLEKVPEIPASVLNGMPVEDN